MTRDALAARQWEALDAEVRGRDGAWPSLPIIPYRAWCREQWAQGAEDKDDRLLLSPQQSAALWRRIVEDSPAGAALLDVRAGARSAADADRLLRAWRVDVPSLRADAAQVDFAAFLSWRRHYRSQLAAAGWLDEHDLTAELAVGETGAAARLVLLDHHDAAPADEALFGALARAGWRIERRLPPQVQAHARRLSLRDTSDEITAAAEWSRSRLAQKRSTRIAVVVPGLARELQTVERIFLEVFDETAEDGISSERDLGFAIALPLHARPVVGAALCGIELGGETTSFASLSRWLRSPFFQGNESAEQVRAARVEAELRAVAALQLSSSVEANAERDAHLRRAAPALAARLADGLREMRMPGKSATPDVWARAWTRGLRRLGWPAAAATDQAAIASWDGALARFVELTPVLGAITQTRAIEELRAITRSASAAGPLPFHGVHVLGRLDDVGPGYAAVWLTGLTDRSFPEAPRTNPLLPRALQIAHRMPGAVPGDSMRSARECYGRVASRTHELILSWPAAVHDFPAQPSPLIAGAQAISRAELGSEVARPANRRRRRLETVRDEAPPFTATRIEGGARTLDLQARCPVRAFCESRLQARALEPFSRGLGARLRGIAMHRALERLLRLRPSREALLAHRSAIADDVDRCTLEALREVVPGARRGLGALFDLERRRMSALLTAFVEREVERPPFTVERLEERAQVRIGTRTIACRIDRVDAVADGGIVLIDYKTGRSPIGTSGWFGERLTSTQLPLYALELGPALAAMVVIGLGGERPEYRGVGTGDGTGSVRPLPDGRSWPQQIAIWRDQIRVLVDEYAAGDTRYDAAALDEALGAYAPLTRVRAHAAYVADEPAA